MTDEIENNTTQPQPYGEEAKPVTQPVIEKIAKEVFKDEFEEQPPEQEWFSEKEDGTFLIKTKRDGDFIFDDIPYDEIMKAKKRTTRTERDGSERLDTDKFELAVISASLIEPKLGELDIMKKKSSTVFKLKGAIYKIYDLNSFL